MKTDDVQSTNEENYSKWIGAIIEAKRKHLGLSQIDVASKLDVSPSTLSRLESGKTIITVNQLYQIAEFFNVNPQYFLTCADDLRVKCSNLSNVKNLLPGLGAVMSAFLPSLMMFHAAEIVDGHSQSQYLNHHKPT